MILIQYEHYISISKSYFGKQILKGTWDFLIVGQTEVKVRREDGRKLKEQNEESGVKSIALNLRLSICYTEQRRENSKFTPISTAYIANT